MARPFNPEKTHAVMVRLPLSKFERLQEEAREMGVEFTTCAKILLIKALKEQKAA